ncbi:hypothetical protein [Anaerobaca lacustris]|uniref:Uroporphyrinogen decarboxylase (URO-D) domain-containing protein n=1 Tax=Anaerobaca lacustris TaxID=3044600 RepID=A0AAW6U4E6_9BACT|nr:hypothetical protein [Sedimentisphaerales bacterium M17dextr]
MRAPPCHLKAWIRPTPEFHKKGLANHAVNVGTKCGHRCLEAILSQTDWTVRILTKNASVKDDFHFIEKRRDRVLIGPSITAPLYNRPAIQLLEPNTSSIQDRMLAIVEAAARGLRMYAMSCPLLPGIADSPKDIERLVKLVELRNGIASECTEGGAKALRYLKAALSALSIRPAIRGQGENQARGCGSVVAEVKLDYHVAERAT